MYSLYFLLFVPHTSWGRLRVKPQLSNSPVRLFRFSLNDERSVFERSAIESDLCCRPGEILDEYTIYRGPFASLHAGFPADSSARHLRASNAGKVSEANGENGFFFALVM